VKPHVRIYLSASGKTADELKCEVCRNPASDIHHIQRRGMGGCKKADRIENLMALCRKCHDEMGDRREWKEYLQAIHNKEMGKWQNEAQKERQPKIISSTVH
jgi:5-methylcytosine-specific restriction endonuclease McrA